MARVDNRAIVTNPLDSSNDYDTLTFYVVVDRPEFGFTSTNVSDLITGFKTWLDATAVGKLFGMET
jgi:predicted Zn-dependent peptidase